VSAARPIVGLTTSWDPAAGDHRRPQVIMYAAYLEALEAVGLTPLLISPAHSQESIISLIQLCEGLVLSGGGDIDPRRYGVAPRPGLDWVFRERDVAEFTAFELALARQVPVFGICRGVQVMNVGLGGTLFQDIDRDRAVSSTTHQQSGPWGARAHDATVIAGSRLREIVGVDSLHINSFHHQSIRDVAPALTVTAVAEDGVIEAVEMAGHPWCVGVQWHPERQEATAPHTDPDRRLFAAFGDAVRSNRVPVPGIRIV
jgi:putative glutamine amidotransferase